MTLRSVEVLAYSPKWPHQYRIEAARLGPVCGALLVRLDHIGSTSVRGLCAKPIIDMLMEVTSLGALDARSQQIEALGYQARGEFGIAGRRYFTLGESPRSHHLHCFESGDAHLMRHRAFRDYLRGHPHVVAEYGQLKLHLARLYRDDIERYMDGKDAFIKHHESQALVWAGSTT
jgi:GrpB-like predicted nucleotidyltransferase (UPF0157 family)